MSTDTKARVVVTGMGVISAIGCDEASFWDSLVAGQTGIDRITAFDPSDYRSQNGAEVDHDLFAEMLAARKWKPLDRTVDMALLASSQALESAGLSSPGSPPEEDPAAVIVGSASGCSLTTEDGYQRYAENGLRGLRPTTIPRCMMNAIASQVSMKFRLTGPNYVVACACSASTYAIGAAFRMIRDGYAQRVLCGGSDACFAPVNYGAWDKLGVMSRNPDPKKACRPFSIDRDGFILGEGAGMLLLETLQSATERGVRIRGEIAGYGESSDAEHITRPSAAGQAAAMSAALASAGIEPKDVDFINAHGTATMANDECESKSIGMVMKDFTPGIPVASNKSFFGHTLGAAGAIETIATLLTVESGRIPPNLNLEDPDPACRLCLVGGQTTDRDCKFALKNNFGFGGSNAVLVLKGQ